jgi:nicotinate-nucleotide adenylyltransferase
MMNQAKKIAIGGSAANPPHKGHLELVRTLLMSREFDKVIWIPSGERQDKKLSVDAQHRAHMTKLLFPTPWFVDKKVKFSIDYSDIHGINTPTIVHLNRLENKFPESKIYWYTGSDSVAPQEKYSGVSEIEARWFEGKELLKSYSFLILPRGGYPHPKDLLLPKQFIYWDVALPDIESSVIRHNIAHQKPWEHLTTPPIVRYIKENHLYQGEEK